MKKTYLAALAGVLGVGSTLGVALIASAPARAAQSTQTITCPNGDLLVRTNNNNSSDMGGWSTAQIVDGGSGHLIPVAFTFTVVNVSHPALTLPPQISVKGNGNANKMQTTMDCTQTQTGLLSSLLGPGESPPPGWNLTDTVTATFTATVVAKS